MKNVNFYVYKRTVRHVRILRIIFLKKNPLKAFSCAWNFLTYYQTMINDCQKKAMTLFLTTTMHHHTRNHHHGIFVIFKAPRRHQQCPKMWASEREMKEREGDTWITGSLMRLLLINHKLPILYVRRVVSSRGSFFTQSGVPHVLF